MIRRGGGGVRVEKRPVFVDVDQEALDSLLNTNVQVALCAANGAGRKMDG